MAALQTEIKTAQQCERDAEDEVKRLKVKIKNIGVFKNLELLST